MQLSPSANSLHLHVNNQLSGTSLNDNSANYSSTVDLHHKVNHCLDNNNNSFVFKEKPGMLQTLFKNLKKKTKNFLPMHSQANQAFMRKVPPGSEADNILVGVVDFLERPLSVFIRLKNATILGDLTEVPVPTRFLFILLGPQSKPGRYHEIGRSLATVMSDEVFHDVAYKSKNREDLLSGIDEFLDAVTILPPGTWDPNIRIEPPSSIPSQDFRKKPEAIKAIKSQKSIEDEEEKIREESGLKRTDK